MKLSKADASVIIKTVENLNDNGIGSIKHFNQKERNLIIKAFNTMKEGENLEDADTIQNAKISALNCSIYHKISIEPKSHHSNLVKKIFKGFLNLFGRISSRKIENKIIHFNGTSPQLYNY